MSLILMCTSAFSRSFFILYALCGLSDGFDGYIARKTGTAGELGSKLDTAADIVFTAVCLIKLLPVMDLPLWLVIWIALIGLIKLINIASGFIVQKKFVAAHTILNKITGATLFALPFSLSFVGLPYSGSLICALATLAAIQEGHLIRTKKLP